MIPKYIVFMAEDTYSPLLWDEDDMPIGEEQSFEIDGKEYSLTSLVGLREWFSQVNKYDPFSSSSFTIEGMEDWINKGFEYALEIKKMLPKGIDMYYGYWHQFGDGIWRYCRAYIDNE